MKTEMSERVTGCVQRAQVDPRFTIERDHVVVFNQTIDSYIVECFSGLRVRRNRNTAAEMSFECIDAANVILRREETAATRSLANTAKVMAENPVLLRLKELEALKEIAAQIDEVKLVVGADGMKTLLPVDLLARGES